MIPVEEFPDLEGVKVGDEIEVFLEKTENQDGLVVLSKQRADFVKVWDRVKTAAEPKPTSSAMASTGSGGVKSSRVAATSSRRRRTRSANVSPVMVWKTRWKCQDEKCATEASVVRSSGSARCPSMWSITRLMRAI